MSLSHASLCRLQGHAHLGHLQWVLLLLVSQQVPTNLYHSAIQISFFKEVCQQQLDHAHGYLSHAHKYPEALRPSGFRPRPLRDREHNRNTFPTLHYPDLCEPRRYVQMKDSKYAEEKRPLGLSHAHSRSPEAARPRPLCPNSFIMEAHLS